MDKPIRDKEEALRKKIQMMSRYEEKLLSIETALKDLRLELFNEIDTFKHKISEQLHNEKESPD